MFEFLLPIKAIETRLNRNIADWTRQAEIDNEVNISKRISKIHNDIISNLKDADTKTNKQISDMEDDIIGSIIGSIGKSMNESLEEVETRLNGELSRVANEMAKQINSHELAQREIFERSVKRVIANVKNQSKGIKNG